MIKSKYFWMPFCLIGLITGGWGLLFYFTAVNSVKRGLQNRLKYSAALLGQSLDANLLEDIRGPEDTSKDNYVATLNLLRELKKSNPDISFIYIMRLEDEKALFVVDSDESDEQAQPGEEYEEDVPELKEGFNAPSVDKEVVTDEWGSYLSGYSPLKNGTGRYLIGIDMRADDIAKQMKAIRISSLVFLVFSLALALIAGAYMDLEQKARKIREHAKTMLEKERERMKFELESAKAVQNFLLPRNSPIVKGYRINGFCRPAFELGGDFYQYHPSPDGSVTIIIGDVSGKGLKAAMFVSLILGSLQTLMRDNPSPVAIVSGLNNIITEELNDHGFATCLVCRINNINGHVEISNAGHIPPYLFKKELSAWSEWVGNTSPGLPLGIAQGHSYESDSLQLENGDALLLLTDGVVEAMNQEREIYGFDRFKEFLKGHSNPGDNTIELLLENVWRFRKSEPQTDDVTAITVIRQV